MPGATGASAALACATGSGAVRTIEAVWRRGVTSEPSSASTLAGRWLSISRRRSPPTPRSSSSSRSSWLPCSSSSSSPRRGPSATTGPVARRGCSDGARRRTAARHHRRHLRDVVDRSGGRRDGRPPDDLPELRARSPPGPLRPSRRRTPPGPTLGQRLRTRWRRLARRRRRRAAAASRATRPAPGADRLRPRGWRQPRRGAGRHAGRARPPGDPGRPRLRRVGRRHQRGRLRRPAHRGGYAAPGRCLAPYPGDRHLPSRHLRRTLGLLPEARRRARQHRPSRHHRGGHRLPEPRGLGDPARGGDDLAHRRSGALDLERPRRRGHPRFVGDPVDLSRGHHRRRRPRRRRRGQQRADQPGHRGRVQPDLRPALRPAALPPALAPEAGRGGAHRVLRGRPSPFRSRARLPAAGHRGGGLQRGRRTGGPVPRLLGHGDADGGGPGRGGRRARPFHRSPAEERTGARPDRARQPRRRPRPWSSNRAPPVPGAPDNPPPPESTPPLDRAGVPDAQVTADSAPTESSSGRPATPWP